MKREFPKLPRYEFSWRAVQLEPIPGSGERITVAALVKGNDKAFIAAKLLNFAKLRSLYGADFATSINDAMAFCMTDAENFYANHPLSAQWMPPFEGFAVGNLAYSLAENIDEALLIAAMSSSSFAVAFEQERERTVNKDVISAPESWRKSIFEAIENTRKEFAEFFRKSVVVKERGIPITIDFLSKRYAAQFEAIAEPRSIQQALVRAQSKLWQLDQIRDAADLFRPSTYELVLRTPRHEIGLDDDFLIEEFIQELRHEAKRREISVFAASSPMEAAYRLIEQAA
ncbi:MAG TPA: hypothetical protein VEF04_13595 [Blastocatellia bacterium]|nr:hypothetical protein [Blastocatellia bacterium]